jgi:tetratricopeptide (TPR) repeat protein
MLTVLAVLAPLGDGPSPREIAERHGASIASDTGTRLVAYFGHPLAHESDPQRAVRAGLEVVASRKSQPGRAQARAAVHTGTVVVGSTSLEPVGSGARDPAYDEVARHGATPALAQRLARSATPGTVLVSRATQQVLGDLLTADAGDLPGTCEAVSVRDRGDADPGGAPVQAPARFIGREGELARLVTAFGLASQGSGGWLNVSGEAGIGRSRLLRALDERLQHQCDQAQRPLWLVAHCSELAAGTPLNPFVGLLHRAIGIDRETTRVVKLRRLGAALRLASLGPIEEAVSLLARLLSIEPDTGLSAPGGSPEEIRHRTLELLATWLLNASRRRPVVLVVEDVEWSDPTSLELLGRIIGRTGPPARVLVLTTSCTGGARRLGETVAAASTRPRRRDEIALDRLSPGEAAELVGELACAWGMSGTAPGAVAAIAEHSDGVPLFIEELVRLAATTGGSPAALGGAAQVPSTLESLLRARLDSVGPAKQVAQVASAIGRTFSPVLLAAVCDLDQRALAVAIEVLEGAGIVFAVAVSIAGEGSARYAFRHALIQEVAYSSMVLRRRKHVHLRIAAQLESRFADRVEQEPELLAYHLAAGGSLIRAANIYERAGRRAARRAALPEAIGHYRLGLELLGELPAGLPAESIELRLQILLGNALAGRVGPGAQEVLGIWERAIDLAGTLGDQLELSSAIAGKAVFHYLRGEYDETIAQSRRMVGIATWTGARVVSLRGEAGLGLGLFSLGNPRTAREHLARATALYRPGDFEQVSYGIGHDIGVLALTVQSAVSWRLGDADRALGEAGQAVELAAGLASALSAAMARSCMVRTLFDRREHDMARKLAEDSVEICRQLGFSFWQGTDQLVLGNETARKGDRAGLDLIDEALTLLGTAGSLVGVPHALVLRADAQLRLGDVSDALQTVEIAMAAAQALPQPYPDPELLRLQARLILAADEPRARTRAEELLVAAVDSAQAHGACISELRSAMALARLMERDGRVEEGAATIERAMLDLSETNDTLDQQDARRLLARLRPGTPLPVGAAAKVNGPRAPIRHRIRRLLRLGQSR